MVVAWEFVICLLIFSFLFCGNVPSTGVIGKFNTPCKSTNYAFKQKVCQKNNKRNVVLLSFELSFGKFGCLTKVLYL